MMTREKDILTQRISEVKAMLDLVKDAPHNRDTLKTACQICNLFLADIEIPDNKRSVWQEQANHSADWRG